MSSTRKAAIPAALRKFYDEIEDSVSQLTYFEVELCDALCASNLTKCAKLLAELGDYATFLVEDVQHFQQALSE